MAVDTKLEEKKFGIHMSGLTKVLPWLYPAFAVVFLGLNIASRLYELIDTTMLGFLINDVAVGFYVAANKMISMVISLMTAVLNTFLPRSSFYYKNNMKSEYTNLVENSFSLALFFSIPATVGMFLLSKSIIMVFSGSEYLPALFLPPVSAPQAFPLIQFSSL